jgi:hypothetical protein
MFRLLQLKLKALALLSFVALALVLGVYSFIISIIA